MSPVRRGETTATQWRMWTAGTSYPRLGLGQTGRNTAAGLSVPTRAQRCHGTSITRAKKAEKAASTTTTKGQTGPSVKGPADGWGGSLSLSCPRSQRLHYPPLTPRPQGALPLTLLSLSDTPEQHPDHVEPCMPRMHAGPKSDTARAPSKDQQCVRKEPVLPRGWISST